MSYIAKISVFLTLGSGLLAVSAAMLGAFGAISDTTQLVSVFIETFKLGGAAIFGLVAGGKCHIRNASTKSRSRVQARAQQPSRD